MTSLYAAIKTLALDRGYSLSTLAEKMGVNRRTLYPAMSGNPRLSNLQRIADGLGFRLSDIIAIEEEIDDPEPDEPTNTNQKGK
ncbi:hypothetical protein BTJ39_03290 [Izhakiella australiensis]|uniref:HTH cro/C1-type domain-containing protein n=1 Tax=Izhakiella australiensis TaxID=1926881 RepID=A0A1S8YTJ0_9GAMM|nr:helix-turn-helix domain-containing protein [Izhakiella australiensis]OON42185.1 hypothetical protein BTJ39_03290 [Izhakiella australiensis]